MPWKACSAMEERLRFVARLLEGEAMTDLCREICISGGAARIFASSAAAWLMSGEGKCVFINSGP